MSPMGQRGELDRRFFSPISDFQARNGSLWKVLKLGNGGLGGNRTHDQRIKSPMLYRLSYQPVEGCWQLDAGSSPQF